MNTEQVCKQLKDITVKLGSRENLLRHIAQKIHKANTLFMREDAQMLDREDLLKSYLTFLTWLDNDILKGFSMLKRLDDTLEFARNKIYYETSIVIQNETLRGIFLPVPNMSEHLTRDMSTQTQTSTQRSIQCQIPAKGPRDYFIFPSVLSTWSKLNSAEDSWLGLADSSMCSLVSSSSTSIGDDKYTRQGDELEPRKSSTLPSSSNDVQSLQSCQVIHSRKSSISMHSIPEFMSIANFESTAAVGPEEIGSNHEFQSFPEINNNFKCAPDVFTASISSSATRIKNTIAESLIVGMQSNNALGVFPSRVASDEQMEMKSLSGRYVEDAGNARRSTSDIDIASHKTSPVNTSTGGTGILSRNAEVSFSTTDFTNKTTVGCVQQFGEVNSLEDAVNFLRAQLLSTPVVSSGCSKLTTVLPPVTSMVKTTKKKEDISHPKSLLAPIRSDCPQNKLAKVVRIHPEERKAAEVKGNGTSRKRDFSTKTVTLLNFANVKWPSWKTKDVKIQVPSHFVPPRNPIPQFPRNSNFSQPLRKRSQSAPAPASQYPRNEH